MSERHFEQSMNPKEHIQSELEDAGISHPSEWRKAVDLETPPEGEDGELKKEAAEKGIDKSPEQPPELGNFTKLLHYIEGDKISDRSKIEAFGAIKDGLARLELLKNMSLTEAAESIRDFGLTPGAYWYLSGRLDFYQKFIEGKAVKRYKTQEWNSEKGQYEDVVKEEIIDSSSATPETIKLGLFRDAMFASMIGTPEMGIFKISNRQCKERKISTTHFPLVKGYHSDIFEGNIGYAYPFLRKTYEKARASVEGRMKGQGREIDEQQIEHRAVMLASSWLTESMNYNPPGRGPESPYVSGNEEAIAWARLGEHVKKQLCGMRQKIQSVDLHGIERFIGKSGDNRYGYEKKRLAREVKSLEDFTQDNQSYDAFFLPAKSEDGTDRQIKGKEAAEIMTRQKNSEAVQRAKLWFSRESEKINHWFEKSKTKIAGYDITEEERNSIYSSVQDRYNKKIADLQQEYQGEIARLENRTPEELLGAFKERQVIVNKRFEKRKSLAQKALDLHFRFNHEGRDYGSKPFDQIDWVNSAPFGVIKRAHRALSAGVDEQTIMMRALAEVNGESANDQNPEKFILNILKSGRPDKVIQNFEKFSGITEDQHLNILLAIINSDAGRNVVESLSKFTGIKSEDHLQIVQAMNASGAGDKVISNLDKFSGIKQEDKRDILFGAIKGGGGNQVANNLEQFSGIISEKDHRDIVMEMIKAGNCWYLNYGGVLDKFTGLEEPLRQVIKAGKYEALPHVLEAGFTIEEITRFPFLISPLVTKK